MKRQVIVLGSTGSIGRNTLDVLDNLAEEWQVAGLAAGSSITDLAEQANRHRPEALAIARSSDAPRLRALLSYDPTLFAGPEAMISLVEELPAECVVSAVIGTAGLPATLRAVELGRHVALANKESLVVAGSILMPLAALCGALIVPVDSEHSGVFQALHAGGAQEVHRIYLTASGGPFRTWSAEAMAEATVEDALHHPTWEMGPKITIDSATMMNKALEIVEARWLFGVRPEQIEVLIHPESIIHSLIEFEDGSLVAHLSTPDMRTPIQYALTYPQRRSCPSPRLDMTAMRSLNLQPPDEERFPALRLGHEVAELGGTAGAVLNGANEAAVELFRSGAISYPEISALTERALQRHDFVAAPSLDELLAADRWAREEVTRCMAC